MRVINHSGVVLQNQHPRRLISEPDLETTRRRRRPEQQMGEHATEMPSHSPAFPFPAVGGQHIEPKRKPEVGDQVSDHAWSMACFTSTGEERLIRQCIYPPCRVAAIYINCSLPAPPTSALRCVLLHLFVPVLCFVLFCRRHSCAAVLPRYASDDDSSRPCCLYDAMPATVFQN